MNGSVIKVLQRVATKIEDVTLQGQQTLGPVVLYENARLILSGSWTGSVYGSIALTGAAVAGIMWEHIPAMELLTAYRQHLHFRIRRL